MSDPVPEGVLIRTNAPVADAQLSPPPVQPSQTRWRALIAWIVAAAIAPALLTISPVIKGASLGATLEQGDYWLIACSVALGATIIEFRLGGKDTPRLLLQLAHLALAFTSLLYFASYQSVSESGAITTKMDASLQATSFAAVLLATLFASLSVLRENGS